MKKVRNTFELRSIRNYLTTKSYLDGITPSRKLEIHRTALLNFKLRGSAFNYRANRRIRNEVPASQPSTSASMEGQEAEEWLRVVIDEDEREIILHKVYSTKEDWDLADQKSGKEKDRWIWSLHHPISDRKESVQVEKYRSRIEASS
ncbi:hypothetical protein CAPTEDRAFT_188160 [Capitella teleta]|uniref:Uncharacterized protein n=1 Tax=Capitella teleta TaxID=283909 RepID=R7UZR0_CAPTE|nr:hypothetical protein CAPTEDRAFT_188160 [Capitella teleta]|eukprot:ELU12073.1 hypothetical protein CAPTEDRAFT_188160 [Capitella teleta]